MAVELFELVGDDDRRFSPYCWRARMALAHKGIEADYIPVGFTEKDRIAFSGQQLVPVLRDGEKIPDSGEASLLHLKENLFLPLRQIPETAQQYANIEKDVIVQGALMKLLLEQKAEALIEARNTVSTIQMLDEATVPEKKARPQRLLIVFIAAVFSAFATTFYILAATYVRELSIRWRAEYGSNREMTR